MRILLDVRTQNPAGRPLERAVLGLVVGATVIGPERSRGACVEAAKRRVPAYAHQPAAAVAALRKLGRSERGHAAGGSGVYQRQAPHQRAAGRVLLPPPTAPIVVLLLLLVLVLVLVLLLLLAPLLAVLAAPRRHPAAPPPLPRLSRRGPRLPLSRARDPPRLLPLPPLLVAVARLPNGHPPRAAVGALFKHERTEHPSHQNVKRRRPPAVGLQRVDGHPKGWLAAQSEPSVPFGSPAAVGVQLESRSRGRAPCSHAGGGSASERAAASLASDTAFGSVEPHSRSLSPTKSRRARSCASSSASQRAQQTYQPSVSSSAPWCKSTPQMHSSMCASAGRGRASPSANRRTAGRAPPSSSRS